jgi:hypothetical protein
MSKRTIAWVVSIAAVLAAATAPAAHAAAAGGGISDRAVEQAPPADQGTGCGQGLDLAAIGAAGVPAVTPAAPAEPLEPVLLAPPLFKRTCRCSCGFPCKTDADCGPGGICGAGITCC